LFGVVRRMLVLDRAGELADLLAVYREVVGIPVVGSDDLFCDGHAKSFRFCRERREPTSGRIGGYFFSRRDTAAASAPPTAPSASADGTPMRAALRAV